MRPTYRLDPTIVRRWIAALRSGRYQQIEQAAIGETPGTACAIGVLMLELGRNDLEWAVPQALLGDVLMRNDHLHQSYATIADWLESLLPPEEPTITLVMLEEPVLA